MADPLSSFESLKHLAYHVFLPPQLPQSELEEAADRQVRLQIAHSVISAARKYKLNECNTDNVLEWDRITQMLERFCQHIEVPLHKVSLSGDMRDMKVDDVMVLYIRAQNAAIIIRKRSDTTVFEAFEVQAPEADIMSVPGKILQYYPGPAVEVPNSVANDIGFVEEIANFLSQMDTQANAFEETVAATRQAGSEVHEEHNSTDPNHFVQLFFGILGGMGEVVEPPRVAKRIADEVLWDGGPKPWRRSPIWLVIRVALQTSLSSKLLYKHFMAFYHADVLFECQQHKGFSSDLLYTMRVKMAKRIDKLKDSIPGFVIEKVKTVAEGVQEVLQSRWETIQADQARSPEWNLSPSDFEAATCQSLPNSRAYLERVFHGRSSTCWPERSIFMPAHKARLEDIHEFTLYSDGALTDAFTEDKHIALFDFESSVFDNLSVWTSRNLANASESCKTVSSCFDQYFLAAKSYYAVDVADQSIMLLTLMKLWVAIDELAIHQIPLLRDFSPELPEDMLDSLLLRTAQEIEHARIIQQYLRSRHAQASLTNQSIFSDSASERTFAVQYFRDSYSLQSLKSVIEENAQRTREKKLQELQEKNDEHAQLDRQLSRLTHEYIQKYQHGYWDSVHKESCERCAIERKRDGLKITLHEWPLPSGRLEAEAVVFELQRPVEFTIWRDTTYRVLRDLGGVLPSGSVHPPATLEGYDELCLWLTIPKGVSARITMASSTKTFIQSHYYEVAIPSRTNLVCVNNGLKYQLHDRLKHHWVEGLHKGVKFQRYGTLSLPKNSLYGHLRYALEGTTHSTNRVLADQYDCPRDLSLCEHIAFGTLRSGPRLQWMNIIRGLEENILKFNCLEVNLLHAQAAWQIGPLTPEGRHEWHVELGNSEYGRLLVSQLNALLNRARANWDAPISISTGVLLATRLLVSTFDPEVLEDLYRFLREARSVALRWLSDLQAKLREAVDESSTVEYRHRVCELACICRSTFDVDPLHLPHLLATSNDIASLIKCSVVLHDNKPHKLQSFPQKLGALCCRDRRISHRVFPHLLQNLRLNRHILCGPISEVWPAYQAGPEGWTELPGHNTRWVSSNTAEWHGRVSQSVYLNLLDGDLIIDSQRLNRLPGSYTQHPTYIRLFGETVLDVVPATSPGMKFTTRDCIHGSLVSFLLDETNNDLVIQAERNGQIFELVHFSHLTDDFPEFFSTDYHHWAHLESMILEFRPLSHPWSSAASVWVLHFAFNGRAIMRNLRDTSLLVDLHSVLFESLSHQLSPIESPRYLHITLSEQPKNQVRVEVPRMRLSFFINEDMQLESNDFRGSIVDGNQSTGTMFGLQNQLVLYPKDSIARSFPRSRSVLIPQGDVRFAEINHHVSVTIHPSSNRNVPIHRYLVDTDLRCLASEAGLSSRLYKIYLHALTSYCLPDTLTGRTGTEEALCGLSESAVSSFVQLDEAQGQLLKLIGSLTPDRKYYPADQKCMQTTMWSALPALSQHFGFSAATSVILERAAVLQIFHPLDFNVRALIGSPEAILLQRATRATSAYYSPGTPNYLETIFVGTKLDNLMHTGREYFGSGPTNEGQIARWAARLVCCSWGQGIYKPINLVSLVGSWGGLEGSCELDLVYSLRWLKLDLSACWITIYKLCRQAYSDGNKFRLAICLASAAFSGGLPLELLPAVISFATNQEFASVPPPPYPHFSLADGYEPTLTRLQSIIMSAARNIEETPAAVSVRQKSNESYQEFEQKRRMYYQKNILQHGSQLARDLMNQWQATSLQPPSTVFASWFDTESYLANVGIYFSSCARNLELRTYLQEIERILSSQPPSQAVNFVPMASSWSKKPLPDTVAKNFWRAASIEDLFSHRSCPDHEEIHLRCNVAVPSRTKRRAETSRLASLLSEFEQNVQPLHRRYGWRLNESCKQLAKEQVVAQPKQLPHFQILHYNRESYYSTLEAMFCRLKNRLAPSNSVEHILFVCGIWPRITPRALLRRLALDTRPKTSSEWLKELISYARLFVDYQRAQRLVVLAQLEHVEEFWKEVEQANADPGIEECDPDWLLVQIDGNFGARSAQLQLAKETMLPSSGSNTILQVNIGEDKSSVIIPLVAAALADTQQLVRIIVPKPLWRQMFHLLVNQLSRLVNRRIYYLPFGRHILINTARSQEIKELYAECMREGGILLAQPEHILSFKLMTIEKLISVEPQEFSAIKQLQYTQDWLTSHTRDILDASDEILRAQHPLVYTMGEQQSLEGHIDRWTTIQQLLCLLAGQISQLERKYRESFDYRVQHQGQFPLIRILPQCDRVVEEQLISALANDVLAGRIQNLNCARLSAQVRRGMLRLLTTMEVSYAEYESLKSACDPAMWRGLLLVRGLLASRVLVFALKEWRYRVDYGLDLSRSLLAVPYRAKDIPIPRAEFSHPDVAAVLTCLSYYYKGLTENQLDRCFELLYGLDNPSLEYERWVLRNNQTPIYLCQLSGVNLKDREQFRSCIIPSFSYNSAVIEFFMTSVVFPRCNEAFSHKIAASVWDLIETKPHVTTGLSETDDNGNTLPTSFTQADPVKQLSTNALVLTYLLQAENNYYVCMHDSGGSSLGTSDLLRLLASQTPEIRVLLDVGAQVAEIRNEEVARCWLQFVQNPEVEAVVYFDDRDELMVLPRNGLPSSFYSSPFSQHLGKCIVYLDSEHMGVMDLKLPMHTRALVTLGPKVTKDHLLRGCMRMRLLGHGHSVMFVAPPEVDEQIRGAAPARLGPNENIDTLDILRWTMLVTCKNLRYDISQWVQQGIEHHRKVEALTEFNQSHDVSVLRQEWMTTAGQNLEEMYGVLPPNSFSRQRNSVQQAFSIPNLRTRLQLLGIEDLEDLEDLDMNERELRAIHELPIEREYQLERPPKWNPATHTLHRDVRGFIRSGQIQPSSTGFVPLFQPLGISDPGVLAGWSTKLFASVDFSRTLVGPSNSSLPVTKPMRPVNWVVQGPKGIRVVLSPYEVNELLPLIRESSNVSLHIYAPRITLSMRSFSNLDFYPIPPRSKLPHLSPIPTTQLQLDLFAGQLYLSNYHEYTRLCAVLGVHTARTELAELGDLEIEIEWDGFVKPENREELADYLPEYAICKFTSSPIPILRELISRRRKGMTFLRTHVGHILRGRNLTPNDF